MSNTPLEICQVFLVFHDIISVKKIVVKVEMLLDLQIDPGWKCPKPLENCQVFRRFMTLLAATREYHGSSARRHYDTRELSLVCAGVPWKTCEHSILAR